MMNRPALKTILILAANPTNTSRLRLDEEIREIDEGLRRANKRQEFKLEQKWAVRSRDFYRAMLDFQPQIVHFCGHGTGEDGIVLEDERGQSILLQTDSLSGMFEVFAENGLECVVLNACYSEVQATCISQHIDYVIGMNRAIGDKAAINFTVAFYDTLAAGKDVETAFKLGCSQLINLKEDQTPVLKIRPGIVPEKKQTNSSIPVSKTHLNRIEDNFNYDVYISYVDQEPDATFVWDTLLPQLEEFNFKIAVSGDVEIPGIARLINIEQGITQSRRTIIVLSEAYMADNMAEFENVLVQTMSVQERSNRLLLVKNFPIEDNCLPIRLSMLTRINLAHATRAEREFKRLVDNLQTPLRSC